MQAHLDRFDLHAGLAIAAQHAHGRIALEKLLRYCARPPIAQDRVDELPDGRITLQLKTPWSDFDNGLPAVPDFHAGAENFRSIDYMAIPFPVMQTLAAWILDGMLDRFPRLKAGVIEQGASWVPGSCASSTPRENAFAKLEERLPKLALRPSEYVKRQVRVTPYPAEDVGFIIQQAGEEVCLFSSDYPHVEGGRNPIKRFEDGMRGLPESAKQRFYADNFVGLMGAAL